MKRKTKRERDLEEALKSCRGRCNELTQRARAAEEAQTQRVDLSMVRERQQVLNSLGYLVDAVSKAIVYVVGKEVL